MAGQTPATPGFASRLSRVELAASVRMTIKARELRAAGKPVVTLTTGEPNFDSPAHAIEAAHQAALKGDTKYPPQDGTRALKEAIQRKFKRDSNLDYALDEICVSNGAKQAIFNAIMATVDPGDDVVIPVPSWIAYTQMVQLCEANPVLVTCPQNNGFKPRAEDIDAAITPKTKWLILNNPNNPTGACCSAEELEAIAKVMRKHPHVWIMSDDMYEHLVFDGFRHTTVAQIAPDLKDRTLTISGVSKTYAMTGWRVGFAGGPKALIKAMTVMQGQVTAGISTVGQAAATAALDGPQGGVDEQIKAYQRRRDIAVEMLNASPGISCHKPEGAFYVFPNVAGLLGKTTTGGRKLNNDEDVCLALLEEHYVATVHGAAYHMSPYLRISTATADDDLVEGLRRIQTFCEGLR
ncbi:pyridoxal phosphate-dependent aminotransferase [Rhodopila sp.]|jgi:aspartate aminotransferase|uniref:pyridoxal phosphate-dependent aminotransferase n=1 Tax=Rhodopila sp. TaxID=2480087 RepID=UPI002C89E8A7|nr:pyridoxal phosphate-dependent aminotransferase [Rhodopila sp.]HVZ09719.1 pyridoxal phosphate-dependent aminotransferase [Rhodopila sp.]